MRIISITEAQRRLELLTEFWNMRSYGLSAAYCGRRLKVSPSKLNRWAKHLGFVRGAEITAVKRSLPPARLERGVWRAP